MYQNGTLLAQSEVLLRAAMAQVKQRKGLKGNNKDAEEQGLTAGFTLLGNWQSGERGRDPTKEEVVRWVTWAKAALGLVTGLIWGLLGLHGFVGVGTFFSYSWKSLVLETARRES